MSDLGGLFGYAERAIVGQPVRVCVFVPGVEVDANGAPIVGGITAVEVRDTSGAIRQTQEAVGPCERQYVGEPFCYTVGLFVAGVGDVGDWAVSVSRADGRPTMSEIIRMGDHGGPAIRDGWGAVPSDSYLLSGFAPNSRAALTVVLVAKPCEWALLAPETQVCMPTEEVRTSDLHVAIASRSIDGPIVGPDGTAVWSEPSIAVPSEADLQLQGFDVLEPTFCLSAGFAPSRDCFDTLGNR